MHTTQPRDLLRYEFAQRAESGYDVASIAGTVEAILADPTGSADALDRVYQLLLASGQRADWTYDEPDNLEAILATLPPAGAVEETDDLADKVHGAWLGRCVGCNLGKPIERGEYWTPERIEKYLNIAGAWPLDDYIPAMEPMPAGFELRECWPETTKGNLTASARDDDIDYTMLALYLIEQHGTGLDRTHVANEWLNRLPYAQTYTAERAAYRNVVDEVSVDIAGEFRNPYREWIGAQIRGDAFGYVNPGNPRQAAIEAYQDASLSHRANGIYGEMWSAALVAAAFTASGAQAALRASLEHIPPRSRLSEALRSVLDLHATGMDWASARAEIGQRWGSYNWVHTVNNACLVAAGLLWGEDDFSKTISLTVVGGWDTDSNGATAGSVAGILTGRQKLPERWTAPLNDLVRSALAGFDNTSISSLAVRTLDVIAHRATSTP